MQPKDILRSFIKIGTALNNGRITKNGTFDYLIKEISKFFPGIDKNIQLLTAEEYLGESINCLKVI